MWKACIKKEHVFNNASTMYTVCGCGAMHHVHLCSQTSETDFGCHNKRFGGCGSVLDVHSIPVGAPQSQEPRLPPLQTTVGILRDRALNCTISGFQSGRTQMHRYRNKREKKNSIIRTAIAQHLYFAFTHI